MSSLHIEYKSVDIIHPMQMMLKIETFILRFPIPESQFEIAFKFAF